MNNLAARGFFVFIAIFLMITFIVNRWIHQEIAETLKPKKVTLGQKPLPAEKIVKEYDMDSDYPPSAPISLQEEMPAVKKTEKVLDEKILYEMPTSNKFLVQ